MPQEIKINRALSELAYSINKLVNLGVQPPFSFTMKKERFSVLWKAAEKDRNVLRRVGKDLPFSLVVHQSGARMFTSSLWTISEG